MDEKKCENCKYFILHYANHCGLYKSLNFGHCVYGKVLESRKRRFYCDDVCDRWESNREKKRAKQDSIEHALSRMADDLNHYLQAIKEEKGL